MASGNNPGVIFWFHLDSSFARLHIKLYTLIYLSAGSKNGIEAKLSYLKTYLPKNDVRPALGVVKIVCGWTPTPVQLMAPARMKQKERQNRSQGRTELCFGFLQSGGGFYCIHLQIDCVEPYSQGIPFKVTAFAPVLGWATQCASPPPEDYLASKWPQATLLL
jgi:hypothetical protein